MTATKTLVITLLLVISSQIAVNADPFTKAGKWISRQSGFGPAVDGANRATGSADAAAKSADLAAQETTKTIAAVGDLVRAITLPITFSAWFLGVWLAGMMIRSLGRMLPVNRVRNAVA